MNTTLALYFGEEFVMAGIEAVKDKFKIIPTKFGEEKHSLFFNTGSAIHYDSDLKHNAKQNPNIITNFYEGLSNNEIKISLNDNLFPYTFLLDYLINSIKKSYEDLLLSSFKLEKKIPIHICFSKSISSKNQKIIKKFFNENKSFFLKKTDFTFHELLLQATDFFKKSKEKREKKFIFIEALSKNLYFKAIKLALNSTTNFYNEFCLKNYGEDRRAELISNLLFNKLHEYSGMNLSKE